MKEQRRHERHQHDKVSEMKMKIRELSFAYCSVERGAVRLHGNEPVPDGIPEGFLVAVPGKHACFQRLERNIFDHDGDSTTAAAAVSRSLSVPSVTIFSAISTSSAIPWIWFSSTRMYEFARLSSSVSFWLSAFAFLYRP